MARLTPLWMQNGSYPSTYDRRLLGALWPLGGVDGMACTVIPGTMNISVYQGTAVVPDSRVPGASYLCTADASEIVGLPAAPPSGLDRIDLIVVRPRDAAYGGADTDWILDPVIGVPAASPLVPGVPAGTLALVQQRVIGGQASLSQANTTDRRPVEGLSVAGVVNRPPLTGTDPLQGYVDSYGVAWVARGGVNGGQWRRATDVLSSSVSRNANYTFPAAPTNVPFDAVVRDPYGFYNGTVQGWPVPVAGRYEVVGSLAFAAAAPLQWVDMAVALDNVAQRTSNRMAPGAGGAGAPFNAEVFANVGQLITIRPSAIAALGMFLPGAVFNWFTCSYRGSS